MDVFENETSKLAHCRATVAALEAELSLSDGCRFDVAGIDDRCDDAPAVMSGCPSRSRAFVLAALQAARAELADLTMIWERLRIAGKRRLIAQQHCP